MNRKRSGRARFAGRLLAVILLLCICTAGLWRVLKVKVFSETYNTTATCHNFYKLEEDSVDVIVLGSSHARCAVIPQVLYDEYGITCYNLSGTTQSLLVSYYWLKEVFQTQEPEVVVLDTYMLFPRGNDGILNSSEGNLRIALDFMHWGEAKWQAVRDICAYDETQSLVDWLLPNARYHDRWKNLDAGDFLMEELTQAADLMGYAALYHGGNALDYEPIREEASEEDESAGMMEVMELYLEKLTNLCAEKGTRLLLIKSPTTAQTQSYHNAVAAFADAHDLTYLDMNVEEIYRETEIVFQEDMADYGHANLYGAQKITRYLGAFLQEQYGLGGHAAADWERTRESYQKILVDYQLQEETDLQTYLSLLAENAREYTVFLAVMDSASGAMSGQTQELLARLGLSADWNEIGSGSCAAVIESGTVLKEEWSADAAVTLSGSIHDGQHLYAVSSAGAQAGRSCSITVDGTEQAIRSRGLNIVVFSNERQLVVDSVSFDTTEEENPASR